MGRPRTGSLCLIDGKLYARVTWTEANGTRKSRRRLAMDEAHGRWLCQDMLRQLANRKRLQPRRAKTYYRENILIYCIQILDGHINPIKIGTSSNIAKRIKMVLTHQPHDVQLLGAWPGSVRDERAAHAMFAANHLAREWFRPTPDLLEYIAGKAVDKAA